MRREEGFTLIEVLASIVILSIVSLVLTSYFTNALSYSKSNQNKTIMVNLARNALFYVQKQDFKSMQALLDEFPEIEASRCRTAGDCLTNYTSPDPTKDLWSGINRDVLSQVLNPVVNGVQYELDLVYQEDIHENLVAGKLDAADEQQDARKMKMAPYLIPVQLEVHAVGTSSGPESDAVVEGYITDEKIR